MATTTTKTNRTTQQGKDQQLIAGIQKDLTSTKSIPLGATTYTPTTLAAFIQSRIDAVNEVITAKAAWQNAAKAYKALDAQANVVVHDLKQYVIGAFGTASPKLADFGFTPRKKAVLTPEQKVTAAAKRAATRVARGTKGPKAKLAIHGTVTSTQPATPAASPNPVTPAVTPAPAPAQATASASMPAPAPAPVQNGATPQASAATPANASTVPVNGTPVQSQAQPMVAQAASTPAQAAVNEPAQAAPVVAQAAAKS